MKTLLASALIAAGLGCLIAACRGGNPPQAHCSGPAAIAATAPNGKVIGYQVGDRVVPGYVWLKATRDGVELFAMYNGKRAASPDVLLVVTEPPIRLDACRPDGWYQVEWVDCDGSRSLQLVNPIDPRTHIELLEVVRAPTATPAPHPALFLPRC